jgi:hypothetical protein
MVQLIDMEKYGRKLIKFTFPQSLLWSVYNPVAVDRQKFWCGATGQKMVANFGISIPSDVYQPEN